MSDAQPYPKRLIEVDLPIKRISEHARREKSIRHGHISTLHIWWARRPLAACRAVICAALWPDPADPLCPQKFRDEASRVINKFARQASTDKELAANCSPENWEKWQSLANSGGLDSSGETNCKVLRSALLDFIADFSNWDNSTVTEYLETSRALTQAAHESLGGDIGTKPLVVDSFAGGGSIPLEGLRVGADAYASDLNPVAVLLNKVMLGHVPKYGERLATEVKKWGAWIRGQAEKEITAFYPRDPDGATPIAYIWARNITCEGPGCGAEVPLIRSLWLSKKGSHQAAVQLVPDSQARRVNFQVIVKNAEGWVDQNSPSTRVMAPTFDGTVKRGSATCPVCGYTTPAENVRQQVKSRSGGADSARLLAIFVDDTKGRRRFRLATPHDLGPIRDSILRIKEITALSEFHLAPVPDEELPYLRSIFNVQLIGVNRWGLLFSSRQQVALVAISSQISKIDNELMRRGYQDEFYKAIKESLALVFGKLADRLNAFARWEPNVQCSQQLYGRQALGIVWDFGELSPLKDGAGSWNSLLDVWLSGLRNVIAACLGGPNAGRATVERFDAAHHPLPDDSAQLFFTDPPYYDAVPYADLSDFFYVWLKRMLLQTEPDLFGENLTPKLEEIVQLSERNMKYASKTKENFERRMQLALSEGRRITIPGGMAVIVFAHKATSAWETMLQAVVNAGWVIVGSWPIDTEMETRLRALNSATLSSSVHLVCRPRENKSGLLRDEVVGDWREVLSELPKRIHEWMPRLAAEGVVGADAIFACLGPALEVFSRYGHVEKASGEHVTLKEYLEYVWAAVAKEALNMIFEGADATGFEEDARLTAMWLWTLSTGSNGSEGATETDEDDEGDSEKEISGFVLEYDAARKIAQGLGAHLEQLPSLVEISGDKARLLPVPTRARHLFGKDEGGTPTKRKGKPKQLSLLDVIGEADESEGRWGVRTGSGIGTTVLDRIHQGMILFAAGRGEALKRFLVNDGVGEDQRFWRLAQALSALYPKGTDERRWVEGVLARKKGLGF